MILKTKVQISTPNQQNELPKSTSACILRSRRSDRLQSTGVLLHGQPLLASGQPSAATGQPPFANGLSKSTAAAGAGLRESAGVPGLPKSRYPAGLPTLAVERTLRHLPPVELRHRLF